MTDSINNNELNKILYLKKLYPELENFNSLKDIYDYLLIEYFIFPWNF